MYAPEGRCAFLCRKDYTSIMGSMDRVTSRGERAEAIRVTWVDTIQYALRGAAVIVAGLSRRPEPEVVVAHGTTPAVMLEDAASLIGRCADLGPAHTGVEWGGFLRAVDGFLASLSASERMAYVNDALVGLPGQGVNSIYDASNGALDARSRDRRESWVQVNPAVEQNWDSRGARPTTLMGQAAIEGRPEPSAS